MSQVKTDIQCLGFIMDGNRRWAEEKGLSSFEGHRKGGEVLRDCIRWVRDADIPHAVYYAFSTENWKRSKEEVEHLMNLMRNWLSKIEKEFNDGLKEEPIRFRFVGRIGDFASDIQERMVSLEERSKREEKARTTIWLALSYGGRAELVEGINQAIKKGESVDEKSFEQLLWTAEMPDPDLIVRTGGQHRLSNFMTWKSVYSELIFLDKFWPSLTKLDFNQLLHDYLNRKRNFGK